MIDFGIKLESGNDAFVDNPQEELFSIIENIKQYILTGREFGPVKDVNGGTVGEWWCFTKEE